LFQKYFLWLDHYTIISIARRFSGGIEESSQTKTIGWKVCQQLAFESDGNGKDCG